MNRPIYTLKIFLTTAIIFAVFAYPASARSGAGDFRTDRQNYYYLPLVYIPSLVKIENVNSWVPNKYSHYTVGEVHNLSSHLPVSATVEIFYEDGSPPSDIGGLVLPVVMPGRAVPFRAFVFNRSSFVERVELIEAPYVSSPRYVSLEVESFAIRPYSCPIILPPSIYISGTLQNPSIYPLHSIEGVVWDFTDTNLNSRFGELSLPANSLAPGETTTFESYVTEPYCPDGWPPYDLTSRLKFEVIGVVAEP